MGLILSCVKPKIEPLVFPAPPVTYNEQTPNFKYIDGVACIYHKVNDNKTTIIYSHGNASDIGVDHQDILTLATDININIIEYDYEGYGLTDGVKSEQGCNRCINKIYNHLLNQGIDSTDIILLGFSIGTGPSIALAHKYKNQLFKAIVLVAPYTSLLAVLSPNIATFTQYTSISNPDMFLNIKKISGINAPITIIHGKQDQIISHNHALNLCRKNKNINLVSLEEGTHHNIFSNYYDELCSVLYLYNTTVLKKS